MSYYLGIDIGTTSVKAIAFSLSGEIISKHSVSYSIHHPQPNQSEQEPDEIFNATVNCINNIVGEMKNISPVFLCFSAAMHSLIAMDENAEPLTKSIIWADNRAAAIAEKLKNSEEGKLFYQSTGVPVHPMSPLCKIIWLKENEPKIFSNAHKFIGIKEYIFFKIFGEYVVETSIASATGLLNIKTLEWDENILNFVGISKEKLSKIVSVKQIFYLKTSTKNSKKIILNIAAETPFVIGGSDGAMANTGEAANVPNAMVVTVGTSIAARIISKKIMLDEAMRTFCYHVKDDEYIIGGAGNNGGIVLQWLKEKIFQDEKNYEDFLKLAEDIPSSSGLLFLPYLLGERAPIWNADAKGIFFGLTIEHTKAHFIRAAMEGVTYALYSIGKILTEKIEIAEIYAGGGFAQNECWLQMLADIFNKQIFITASIESSALGAVITGMEALNIKPLNTKRPSLIFYPDPVKHNMYMQGFKKFERVYTLLKEEF
jgi:gluconokinase